MNNPMNSRERADLDRYITGNYGEDQFKKEPDPEDESTDDLEDLEDPYEGEDEDEDEEDFEDEDLELEDEEEEK